MSILIWDEDTTVLDDYVAPAKTANTEADAATRFMIVQADDESDALATVAVGDALPDHGNMFCVRGRAKPRVCGKIYAVEFDYLGMWGAAKRTITVTDGLEGWDTGIETQIVVETTELAAKAHIYAGSGASEYPYLICTNVVAEPVVQGKVWKVTGQRKGVTWEKPIKWIPRGYFERQSMKAAVYPGQATPVPVESNQNLVAVIALWVTTAGVPDCSVTGTNVTPDFSPGVPDNIWSAIPNPVHVYPYGWVLESREPDIIPDTGICLVKDVYVYYQHYKPGNA